MNFKRVEPIDALYLDKETFFANRGVSEKLTEKVDFEIIRYANCWEDADVLLKGFDAKKGGKILSVGSAGDNSFSLLTTEPEIVVAIDISPVQLYLIELKQVAIQYLEYEEVLGFLGFWEMRNRLGIFEQLKEKLHPETANYWSQHAVAIKNGVIHQGKFEKYFQLFVKKVLPLIHSKKTIHRLFATKSSEEQINFYHKRWNNWRWKALFRVFFSRFVMGRFGRDPEFLKQVEVNVGSHIFKKAEQQLKSTAAQQNFILRYNLTGNFGDLLPHYLQLDNFQTIKKNINKLHLQQGFAQDAIQEHGSFDYMNLSNIFEYMDEHLFKNTTQELVEGLSKGGKMAYWNLMVQRRISSLFPLKLSYRKEISEVLTDVDKGFFYDGFFVDELI